VVTWSGPRAIIAKNKVKLLLNLYLTANAAIPRGGHIDIVLEDIETAPRFRISARGSMLRVPPEFLQIHSAQFEDAINAHSVQAYYTVLLAQEAGMDIGITATPEEIVFTAEPA